MLLLKLCYVGPTLKPARFQLQTKIHRPTLNPANTCSRTCASVGKTLHIECLVPRLGGRQDGCFWRHLPELQKRVKLEERCASGRTRCAYQVLQKLSRKPLLFAHHKEKLFT